MMALRSVNDEPSLDPNKPDGGIRADADWHLGRL